MLATTKDGSGMALGQHIIIVGLVLQVLFFTLFLVVAIIFHYRINKAPTQLSQTVNVPWMRYLWVLYGGSLLIMIRNLFRVIEYSQGQDGYLLSTETWLYVFDASLMLINMVLFQVLHPSKIISNRKPTTDIPLYNQARDGNKSQNSSQFEQV